jgi:hypothetical protein
MGFEPCARDGKRVFFGFSASPIQYVARLLALIRARSKGQNNFTSRNW